MRLELEAEAQLRLRSIGWGAPVVPKCLALRASDHANESSFPGRYLRPSLRDLQSFSCERETKEDMCGASSLTVPSPAI